jgi:hypothetical protein
MKDFQRQADILGGQLQGYQFGMGLLNSVFMVRDVVEPFLQALHNNDQNISLLGFCQQVAEKLSKFPNLAEMGKRLDKLTAVLDHLAEVRMWFSQKEGLTLDTILPFATRLWQFGHYRSNTGYV